MSLPLNLPSAPMRYARLSLLQCRELTHLAKGSNVSCVDNLSSTPPNPEVATSKVVSDNANPGSPPSAALAPILEACYST